MKRLYKVLLPPCIACLLCLRGSSCINTIPPDQINAIHDTAPVRLCDNLFALTNDQIAKATLTSTPITPQSRETAAAFLEGYVRTAQSVAEDPTMRGLLPSWIKGSLDGSLSLYLTMAST